jgi:dihydropteroate synthase
LAAGAAIVNDIRGLRDPAMAELVRRTGAGAVVMHMQGEPRTMQDAPMYEDVAGEIREFFRQSFSRLVACGMRPSQIVFDPGIGFGKTVEHNLALLKNPAALRVENRPLLLGFSRKAFLAKITGAESMPERLAPTLALTALGRAAGADIFRVHDVLENVRALRMVEAFRRTP